MRLDDVKSYADLMEYFVEQSLIARRSSSDHARVHHSQKAAELNAKANLFYDLYKAMLVISDAQEEGGAE